MKGLDLRKFKKLHSDEHTTTMVHPDGHQIKIAHKRLKEGMRKQLADLPKFSDGGKVEIKPDYNPDDPNLQKDTDKRHTEGQPKMPYVKTGTEKTEDVIRKGLNMLPRYSEGTPDAPVSEADIVTDPNRFQAILNKAKEIQNSPPAAELPADQYQSAFVAGPGAAKPVQPKAPPPPPSGNPSAPAVMPPIDISGGINAAEEQRKQGVQAEATAVGQQGAMEANAANQQIAQAQKLQSLFTEQSNKLQNEIKAVTEDYNNGHIDPNRLWTSKSDLGKVSTAIGLLLGGIGAGLTGGPNVALDFLNKQIDRDIDAQKMEMGKKHNMLAALQQQYGNLKDATTAARLMYMDIYSSQIAKAGALSKDPIAKAKAQEALGRIELEKQQVAAPFLQRQMVFQGQRAGAVAPAQAVPILVPEHQQQKALDEIKDTEVRNKTIQEIQHGIEGIKRLSTAAGMASQGPYDAMRQREAFKKGIMASGATLFGGSMTDSARDLLESAITNWTDSPETAEVQLDRFYKEAMKFQSTPTLNAYGITPPPPPVKFKPGK